MRIFQDTIERSLYVLLLLTFIAAGTGLFLTVKANNLLAEQQDQFHTDSLRNLKTIEDNQIAQSQAIKVYIDCLVKINPQGDIPAQESACFNNAPVVHK